MNRKFRLVAALGMAVVLSTFMLYVGLSSADVSEPVLQASELVSKSDLARSTDVQVDGIAAGPVTGDGTKDSPLTFTLTDRGGDSATPVTYVGSIPDAFRVGRNVIVTGKLESSNDTEAVFVARPGSLVTKCPSKFESDGDDDK